MSFRGIGVSLVGIAVACSVGGCSSTIQDESTSTSESAVGAAATGMGSMTPAITLANVCSTPLGNTDPGCITYCSDCRAKSEVSYQLSMIGGMLGGVNVGTGYANFLGTAVAGLPSSQVLAVNACAVGVLGAASSIAGNCMTQDCLTSGSTSNVATWTSTLCTAASCFVAANPALLASPWITGSMMACGIGAGLAKAIACNDYTALGLQGAEASCKAAIDAAQPIGPGVCSTANSFITVRACNPAPMSGPRSANDVQTDCALAVVGQGVTGTEIGACASLCVANTQASQVNCTTSMPTPVAGPQAAPVGTHGYCGPSNAAPSCTCAAGAPIAFSAPGPGSVGMWLCP